MKRREHSGIVHTLRMVIAKLLENPEFVQIQTASKYRNKHRNTERKGLEGY